MVHSPRMLSVGLCSKTRQNPTDSILGEWCNEHRDPHAAIQDSASILPSSPERPAFSPPKSPSSIEGLSGEFIVFRISSPHLLLRLQMPVRSDMSLNSSELIWLDTGISVPC